MEGRSRTKRPRLAGCKGRGRWRRVCSNAHFRQIIPAAIVTGVDRIRCSVTQIFRCRLTKRYRANPPSRSCEALTGGMRAARGAEARIIRTRRGERWPATPAAFLLRLAEPRSIVVLARDQRSSYEDRPSGRWPAIYCCWAFLVRTRDGITRRATQCCTDRRRRGLRSLRYLPSVVRMAVAGAKNRVQ